MKYIQFNVSRPSAPTWVHIASEKPFAVKPGRYGRWSSTVCGKGYEMDDYRVVKDEQEALARLCKRCAKQKRQPDRGPDVDLGYEERKPAPRFFGDVLASFDE